MKRSRGEEVSSLTPFGIRSISCIMSSQMCSSLVIDKDIGVGGGYLGYGGKFGISLGCGGKFKVDFVLCRPLVRNEKVDLVFRMILSIGESVSISGENFRWSQVVSLFVLVDHIAIRREGRF